MLSYYLTIHAVARCLISCKHTLVKTAAQTLNSHHTETLRDSLIKEESECTQLLRHHTSVKSFTSN